MNPEGCNCPYIVDLNGWKQLGTDKKYNRVF